MSKNIHLEAGLSPAVHSLRRMAHSTPSRAERKGSYELYEPQQKSLQSPERIGVNSIAGAPPGSPGCLQDYGQIVQKLQQELEQSKRKECELQQMLLDLKNPISSINTMFMDTSYIEESPSNENIGENVKDAHIRHLQRQVTVLQASLYKSEGWSNRVAAAVKERDKALDDVAHLTSQIREMQEVNGQLLHKIETLSTNLQETHANLKQTKEELHNNKYHGQLVLQLKDEIHRQGYEIKSLKESHNQLDTENKSLKDSTLEANSHTLNSLTCSEELEHLHKVVDRLKSTVLQQRSYLLQLRQSSSTGNAKSLNSSSVFVIGDNILDHESIRRRNSSSPKLRASGTISAGNELGQRNPPHHAVFEHQDQAAILKSRSPKENLENQQAHHRGSSDFLEDLVGSRRRFRSNDKLKEALNANILDPLFTQGAGFIGSESGHVSQLTNKVGYIHPIVSPNLSAQFGHQTKGDVPKQNLGMVGVKATTETDSVKSLQHKINQSKGNQEVVDHRIGYDVINQNKFGNNTNVFPVLTRKRHMQSANNSATLPSDDTSDCVTDVACSVNTEQIYTPPMFSQQEARVYEVNALPLETLGQYVFHGNDIQMKQSQSGNIHLNPATSKPVQFYNPSSNFQKESSVFPINNNMMVGGKVLTSASPTHTSTSHGAGSNQQFVYTNTFGDQGICATETFSVDQNSSRIRQNSERLCPVCSNEFSHMNMEEFQTHIFECFDDENSPATMKPHETPERCCPMCNAKFSPTIDQAEFERHVHNHFGDEAPGTNFVILQP